MYCVSIANGTYEECKSLILEHPLVELRLDLLKLSHEEIAYLCQLPAKIIATCRASISSVDVQRALLLHAAESGASYVDIELGSSREQLEIILSAVKQNKAGLIVSYHNFIETPSFNKLERIVEECISCGADIVKIACKVLESKDNLHLISLLNSEVKLVVVGMGKEGRLCRIVAPFLGSLWTYVASEAGKETAEGQLSLEEYKELMLRISNCKDG